MASVEKGDERSGLEYQLEEALDRALDEAARRLDRRRSDVVRMALRQFLFGGSRSDRPAERVRNLLGSVESGISRLGEAHIAVAGRRILCLCFFRGIQGTTARGRPPAEIESVRGWTGHPSRAGAPRVHCAPATRFS